MREERQVQLLYFLTDVLIYWIALNVVTFFRLDTIYQVDFVQLQRDRGVCILLFALAAAGAGAYRSACISDRFDAIYTSMLTVGAAAAAELTLTALVPVDVRIISRRELVLNSVLALFLLSAWHYWAPRVTNQFKSLWRFFYVLGNEQEGHRIAEEITKNRTLPADARYVSFEALMDIAVRRAEKEDYGALPNQDVIIALAGKERERLAEILGFCEEHFRQVFLYPSLNDMLLFHHSSLLAIGGIPLIEVASKQVVSPYLLVKRTLDVVLAGLGLVLSLPLWIVTGIAVKATSPGSIFYLQERLGRNGRPFKIIKFRSMLVAPGDPHGYQRAEDEKARITPVGRLIRKHRIDELPQLINVLKGDMSLIGPRPLWREFFGQHGESSPLWERRLAVRPGLTSLSHVLGNSLAAPADFLRYDLVYISSLSLMLDLRILIATVRTVLSGRGTR